MIMWFIKPERNSRLRLDLPSQKDRLICKICKTWISEFSYLCVIDSDSPYHTFENLNGHRFDIMTLSLCKSVIDVSPPSFEHTWFSGYAWVILCCEKCHEHLGWRFESSEKKPPKFFGLIQEKLEVSS